MQNFDKINIEHEGDSEANLLITASNKKVKPATIIKFASLAICILFFFPLFTVSCSDYTISFTGFDATFGKAVNVLGSSERVDGNFASIFLLIIPLAIFLAFQLKKIQQALQGKIFYTAAGLSVAGIAAMNIFKGAVRERAQSEMLHPEFTATFNIMIFLYIIVVAIAAASAYLLKKNRH